ncbi:Carboxylesterase NlhH [Colletotrichum trifolii]|uniref:Carboxylesterase NlhH n=1 Tax=Colletotrichum trifolii TaxID=5466 RepID=A0A4R8RTU2_COLTR|nr:Carboxylesterase NlhH [Colletotrichum trifolii]
MGDSSVNQLPRPPYDAQLVPVIGRNPPYPRKREDVVHGRRIRATATAPLQASIRNDVQLSVEDRTIPGPDCDIPLVILQSKNPGTPHGRRPGIVFVHGGGMLLGDAFLGLAFYAQVAKTLDAVVASVEYRLAPEHPAPAPQDDCFAALRWVSAHAAELGIDPARVMMAGASAGGGIAAGVALRARDQGGPPLCAQLLVYPMLDDRDRNRTASGRQYARGRHVRRRRQRLCLVVRAGGQTARRRRRGERRGECVRRPRPRDGPGRVAAGLHRRRLGGTVPGRQRPVREPVVGGGRPGGPARVERRLSRVRLAGFACPG